MQDCDCKCEDLYCSQQICIPPMFPYILRQYAKAAIRSQPNDLLRWSTAYFRCLALGLAPPVKPRLEYPLPRSHYGITPGWLKALLRQYENNQTISFKILWDKWIGACLHHRTLIEILCLGGFTQPHTIPWLRFIGLCAAHLTDNLTNTMILVCEVITEEPEGGAAIIPLEVFCDIYQFLANIDASAGQWLKNLYFTDSLLSLYREPSEEVMPEAEEEPEEVPEEEEVEEEEMKVAEEEEVTPPDLDIVISCPDIMSDDFRPGEEMNEDLSVSTLIDEEDESKPEESEGGDTHEIVKYLGNVDQAEEEAPGDDKAYEDLKKLLRLEVPEGEMIEFEEPSEEEGPTPEISEVAEPPVEEVWVEAVPGIGAIVPPQLVKAVEHYMKECAAFHQHGMVMPRNVRHYSCPPLEVFKV